MPQARFGVQAPRPVSGQWLVVSGAFTADRSCRVTSAYRPLLSSWVNKYRTGSGSDRVNRALHSSGMKDNPVATAPGSVFV